MATQPFEVSDFSGGKTDNYISGDQRSAKVIDNLFLTFNRKLRTRYGSTLVSTTRTLPGFVGATARHNALISFEGQLFELSGRRMFYDNTGYTELVGPSSNYALPAGTTANYPSWAIWNKHLILTNDALGAVQKVYKNDSNVWCVRTAGLPAVTAPTATPTAGSENYIYAFCYFYEYTIGTVTFQDYGPTTQLAVESAAAPDSSIIALSVLPVISNGSTGNYDTSNIKLKIYRTQSNGSVFYYVGEVTNGTTTYDDSSSDATISANEVLYTEGGVLDNDPPLPAKYLTIANDCCWYAHVKDGTSTYPNRVMQSVPFDPDSVPAANYVDVEDEIVGIGAVSIYPIIFCKNKMYRVEGIYDLLGRDGAVAREISRTIGCVSHLSIVSTRDGVFFAGNDGFYFTDGSSVTKISEHLNETYKTLITTTTQQKNIYGVFDNENNKIWWAVQFDTSSGDNDGYFVLDLNYPMQANSVFTTISGSTNFAPSASTMHGGYFIRGDKRGYLFKHASGVYTDPKVDTLVSPTLWEKAAIIYDYQSCAYNFGTDSMRKWVPTIVLNVEDRTNVSVAIKSQNDDSALFLPLKEIKSTKQLTWGDPSIVWGDETTVWNFNEIVEANRRFPATGLRCSYKQIQLTNAFTNIYKSDTVATCTVDATAKTAVIDSGTWPNDLVDYYLTFSDDGYEAQYLITARTSSTLTFTDPLNSAVSGAAKKWVIKGYAKGEILDLVSYVIWYEMLSDTQPHYKGEQGSNA